MCWLFIVVEVEEVGQAEEVEEAEGAEGETVEVEVAHKTIMCYIEACVHRYITLHSLYI